MVRFEPRLLLKECRSSPRKYQARGAEEVALDWDYAMDAGGNKKEQPALGTEDGSRTAVC